MSFSRRQILAQLRLRNIVMFTLIVILSYIVKLLTSPDATNSFANQAFKFLPLSETYNPNKDVSITSEPPSYPPPPQHLTSTTSRTTLKRIDWHNYTLIEHERMRVGIGEQGKPALLKSEEQDLQKTYYAAHGFNGLLSDKIPLNRSLPDIRYPTCAKKVYIESLPTVSVVVPFHNEHWSTLLRTAFSVLLRSPSTLLKEVLLVDDASDNDFLGRNLDDYLAKNMSKVRVIRLKNRSGLVTARLAGAKEATGDVLLFLDSHVEANVNWLPPLLEPIALNYRTVTCPFIDVVADDTFEYKMQDSGRRGAFDWKFDYKRLPILPEDEQNMPEPFENPIMAGGLFAISRKFFWELGGYDPGLDIWGGEQYELSFKIWQCGGRLLDVPCSRVGHIYRSFGVIDGTGHGDYLNRNYRRVAEVWMDEYAEFLYARNPLISSVDPGDVSAQKALRKKLQCKSFKWFLTQIAFDLTAKYPTVDPNPFASGRVRPVLHPSMCIDAHHGEEMDKLNMKPCAKAEENEFLFTFHKDVRSKTRDICWDLPESANKSPILLYSCHLGGGNQLWRYNMDTKHIRHGTNDRCVEYSPSLKTVFIFQCNVTKKTQKWIIDKVDNEMMAKWWMYGERVTRPIEKA